MWTCTSNRYANVIKGKYTYSYSCRVALINQWRLKTSSAPTKSPSTDLPRKTAVQTTHSWIEIRSVCHIQIIYLTNQLQSYSIASKTTKTNKTADSYPWCAWIMRLKLIAIGRRHAFVMQMHSKRWVPLKKSVPLRPQKWTPLFFIYSTRFLWPTLWHFCSHYVSCRMHPLWTLKGHLPIFF